ncbi:inaA protein [Endozoicomonas sp. SM1973]|uniref:InaA protein n=1 Tax=Spartinivicinus marinus TaxID=2994442 RepID=A0A853I535_9GAMM|nr:lipopolysaccharide kinase InaA family protein [Spartinivicinus marinus]MCX4025815.1 hypothetical protein [Spartinivicinus marinus]NYZ65808.1 inaA protein [Spartinivicinus marinus]
MSSKTHQTQREFFTNPTWQAIFESNHFYEFEDIWQFPEQWVEPPNQRRNGWSGVSKIELQSPASERHPVFIKKQFNHNTKTIRHPIRGIPTFSREFSNLQILQQHNIPTAIPLYYGERHHKDGIQAILITQALEGYCSLEQWYQRYRSQHLASWQPVLKAVARSLKALHDKGYTHNCLYPKHIFVNDVPSSSSFTAKLIDLEKAKRNPLRKQRFYKDLARFIRHTRHIAQQDLDYFISQYLSHGKSLKNEAAFYNILEHHVTEYEPILV